MSDSSSEPSSFSLSSSELLSSESGAGASANRFNPPESSTEAQNRTNRNMDVLSRLIFGGYAADFAALSASGEQFYTELEYVAKLSSEELRDFSSLANDNHVLVRALQVLEQAAIKTGNERITGWCQEALTAERNRAQYAASILAPICSVLESAGAKVAVIKSLDHWPDLGSDLDLYTTGSPRTIRQVMRNKFGAEEEARSWGDRLAHKWNFKVPGLPESVEIHVRNLGQTGEQTILAQRVVARRLKKSIHGLTFYVPAPEERVLISTLQRMYRHFYFRLCDMADFAMLLRNNAIDFVELRSAAMAGRIWPGVANFLLLVSEYAKQYGSPVRISHEVLAAAPFPEMRVQVGGNFLRIPKGPAAGLYRSQLVGAGIHGDLRAALRLSMLPPLAVSAFVAYHITGSDKGVW